MVQESIKYNKTQLDPDKAFERHIYHRDMFSHYLRWTHILKEARIGMNILDFGCGTSMNLAEVLYRNRFKCNIFVGMDIRSLNKKGEKLIEIDWIDFQKVDLVDLRDLINSPEWDIITSFEVIEHVGKSNAEQYLMNVHNLMSEKTRFFLSTPNFDEKVGAASNHIIDGVIGEFKFYELKELLEKYFTIEDVFGTFASQKDYKFQIESDPNLSAIYERAKNYYDSNLLSNFMAPLIDPSKARNCMWVLKKK